MYLSVVCVVTFNWESSRDVLSKVKLRDFGLKCW